MIHEVMQMVRRSMLKRTLNVIRKAVREDLRLADADAYVWRDTVREEPGGYRLEFEAPPQMGIGFKRLVVTLHLEDS